MPETSETNRLAWVCATHPKRMQSLFAALDLEHQGLETVKTAAIREDWPAAGEALLAYYRQSTSGGWLRHAPVTPTSATDLQADTLLRDSFVFYTVEGTVPRRPDGGLDWQYQGPHNDPEWALALNRHFFLSTLLTAYYATGNPVYAHRLDAFLRDWVLANPYFGRANADFAWRGLEVSFRPKAWAPVFFGLLADEAFSPATRLLLLSSLPDHADYLRRFHNTGNNWTTMEMSGLALISAAWPEFKQAPADLDYARGILTAEMTAQKYPDGVQKELASHYHYVSLINFEQFATTLRHAGLPVPDVYAKGLEGMWNYLAYSVQPDGANPLNNDSDRDDYREILLGAAKTYGRPDWAFIVSNGAQGTVPAGVPSVVFPWAGQVIMRSGWEAKAQYAFFDVGPWGTAHQHNDKLHLSLSAGGRELLVDSGRYTYVSGDWRRFFLGSSSHNVILIDGQGQCPSAPATTVPLASGATAILPDVDYVQATFSDGYQNVEGVIIHTRAVVYLRGKFWVVFDRVEADRPRTLTALWHFHPACTVTEEYGMLVTTDPDVGNLRLVPVGGQPWQLHFARGQEKPVLQGWYSVKYNLKEPATCGIYTLRTSGTTTCAWVIVPDERMAPVVRTVWHPAPDGTARLTIAIGDQPPTEIAVRLSGTGEVPIGCGLKLDGACAVLREGQPPLVVHGQIRDA
jgi:hypothetical protein